MINLLSFSKYVKITCQLGIDYMNIYQKGKNGRNDLSALNQFSSSHGIYFFANHTGVVIYVGEAHDQSLKDRISQHFQEGTGSLRTKLKKFPRDLEELSTSVLYVFPVKNTVDSIKNIEAALIRLYQPKFNDNLK